TAALLARALLARYSGERIVYDVRYTWAVIDAVEAAGGVAIPSRVGHSFIKEALRRHRALFCGEASGHTYFRDYCHADSGLLPLLLMLELLGRTGKDLSELVADLLGRYFITGEMNARVADPEAVIAALEARYADADVQDRMDGLTVEYGRDWRFN